MRLRRVVLLAAVLAAACGDSGEGAGGRGGGGGSGGSGGAGGTAGETFTITVPDVVIAPGERVSYCFHTRLDNERAVGVQRWSSTMTAGVGEVVLFLVDEAEQPDGTVERDCALALDARSWTYSAQTSPAELVLPAGLGMSVKVRQPVIVRTRHANPGTEPLTTSVRIDALAHAAGEAYTPAATYVTYRSGFAIPPGATGTTGGSCPVPEGFSFLRMSTRTHGHATLARISDGATTVLESTDWEHPAVRTWDAAPFFTFGSGHLTYHCEYDNTGGIAPLLEGPDEATDEVCMAIAHYFPASAPRLCLNDVLLPE